MFIRLDQKLVVGRLVDSAVERLPAVQGMFPGCGIESHIGLSAGGLLLPLPVSVCLSLSIMNKFKKK